MKLKKKHDFPKMRGRGSFGTFPKIPLFWRCLELFQKFIRFFETTPVPYHQTNKYLKLLQSSPSPSTLWGLGRIELNLLQIFLTSLRYSHRISSRFRSRIVSFQAILPCCCKKLQLSHLCDIFFSFLLEQNITG